MKVQAVRSEGQKERLYVNVPVPLAAAIAMQAGEEVEWELLGRGELHLIRCRVPKTRAKRAVARRTR